VVFVESDARAAQVIRANLAAVALPGGELEINWRADDRVLMTGEAVDVFDGHVEV